jgi:hypothetical protein
MIRLIAATLILAAPAVLYAQDRWEGQVRSQIATVTALAQELGFSATSESFRGQLNAGGSDTLTVTLDETREHIIAAVCDEDCTDVDLVLTELSGGEIVADLAADDRPMLAVPAGHRGAHVLRVEMAACSIEPCRYEIAVFSR